MTLGADIFVFIRKVRPGCAVAAALFDAFGVLGREFQLSEFLRKMLRAVSVVKLWNVRSCLLLFIDQVPVDVFKPEMRHDIHGTLRA